MQYLREMPGFLCLTLGITCAILIFGLVTYHLSFDTFHSNKDRIYRITTELHQDEITVDASVPQPIGKAFSADNAFGEKVAIVCSTSDWLVSIPSSEDNKKI